MSRQAEVSTDPGHVLLLKAVQHCTQSGPDFSQAEVEEEVRGFQLLPR